MYQKFAGEGLVTCRPTGLGKSRSLVETVRPDGPSGLPRAGTAVARRAQTTVVKRIFNKEVRRRRDLEGGGGNERGREKDCGGCCGCRGAVLKLETEGSHPTFFGLSTTESEIEPIRVR